MYLDEYIGVRVAVVFALCFPPADASMESGAMDLPQFVVVNLAWTLCHTFVEQGLDYSGFQHSYPKVVIPFQAVLPEA